MSDDDQVEKANKFARKALGAKADTPAGKFKGEVLPGGKDGGDDAPEFEFIKLPGVGRPLGQFAVELGQICREQAIYRREAVPVIVNRETGAMEALAPACFVTYVEEFCVPHIVKPDGVDDEGEKLWKDVPKSMTQEMAKAVLSSERFIYSLRKLDRVNTVRMPVMRRDGRIELLPEGYDSESKVYTMPSKVKVEEVPVREARAVLDSLYKEFPFGDHTPEGTSRSKAVALSALLSLYGAQLQGMTARRLNFLFTANRPRSGKSLLAEVAIIIATGSVEIQTVPDKREELRKILETEAMASAPYIYFDNLKGVLDSPALEAFMTAPIWSGRIMNSQKKFKAPKVSQLFLTGNNLKLSTDIANRVLHCDLYVREADPQARKIKRVIDHTHLAKDEVRSEVLSALWTLIKYWDEQKRPRPERLIKGFEEWSHVFGGIIECNGWGDPLVRPDVDNSGDTELRDMSALIELLADGVDMGSQREYQFAEIGTLCIDNSLFEWMIGTTNRQSDVPGQPIVELDQASKSRVGRMLNETYGGSLFTLKDGRKCEFGTRGTNRHKKWLVTVSE